MSEGHFRDGEKFHTLAAAAAAGRGWCDEYSRPYSTQQLVSRRCHNIRRPSFDTLARSLT